MNIYKHIFDILLAKIKIISIYLLKYLFLKPRMQNNIFAHKGNSLKKIFIYINRGEFCSNLSWDFTCISFTSQKELIIYRNEFTNIKRIKSYSEACSICIFLFYFFYFNIKNILSYTIFIIFIIYLSRKCKIWAANNLINKKKNIFNKI